MLTTEETAALKELHSAFDGAKPERWPCPAWLSQNAHSAISKLLHRELVEQMPGVVPYLRARAAMPGLEEQLSDIMPLATADTGAAIRSVMTAIGRYCAQPK